MKKHNIVSEEIISLEASANYTLFHLSGGSKVIYAKTLKIFVAELASNQFFVRVSRSVIVNKRYVVCIRDNKVCLEDGTYYDISKRRKKSVCLKLN